MNNIRWLFFDVGSTLVDESLCIKERFNIIIKKNKIEEQTFAETVLKFAKKNCFAVKSAAKVYNVEIPEWNTNLEKLYSSVDSTLNVLSKKYKLGIIANQCVGTANRLNKWGIGKYFDIIISSAEEGCSKPDLKIFKLALKKANCNASECIMIGDRIDNDILPAEKIGMKTIWVRQGFAKYRVLNESEKPDYIIQNINELTNIL